MISRRDVLCVTGASLIGAVAPSAAVADVEPRPVAAEGSFRLVKNWTFGAQRKDSTIHNLKELRAQFRFRYIYDQGRLDTLPTYWTVHRDYPEGDPRSLHVFSNDALTLKARVPPGGGMRRGGIESGMLRALLQVTPGMYVEMRAKLPRGLGVWPAFWLNPGVEYPDGHFSELPWPPEIDIFEFFVWQGRDRPRYLEAHIQTNGHAENYGNPHDLFSLLGPHGYDPGVDFSEDFHVFALDWVENKPIWVVDGRAIKQTVYEWHAPAAHVLVTNQIGMSLPNANLTGMKDEGDGWDYTVDYLRVWQRS